MDKQYIIAGNWKMFKTVEQSVEFVTALDEKITGGNHVEGVEVVVCPPFTSLYAVRDISGIIKTGAQNIYHEEEGAFTGEISPLMLENIVQYVLIGHSERRQVFGEEDEGINKKVKTALAHGLVPVLCIGESLEEREAGSAFDRLNEQLDSGLAGLSAGEIDGVVIAYEPIWAIGTGKTATPEQAQEVHAHIRKKIAEKTKNSENLKILYGGSVKPGNSYDILSQNDVNGVLVGGASLKVEDFYGIIGSSYRLANP